MVRTLLFTLISFVVQLNAFADAPLQQCRQLYSEQDSRAVFETCLPLAVQGNGEASFILSNLYTQGVGDNQPDLKSALVWLIESAKQGHGPACYNLAALYERGEVVEQDYSLAYSWYERGAERGHTDSQFKVGSMSLKGIGTEKNARKAQAWLNKAAESGSQSAQITLAVLLSVSDAEKSFDWYSRAADQGNSYAYSQLAEAYADGRLGQPVELKKALYLAQKSVILGRAGSQELVDRIRQKIKNSAPQILPSTEEPEDIALENIDSSDLTPTKLAVSEKASSEASIFKSVEKADTIYTAEIVTTETSVTENNTPKTAASKASMANTELAEGFDAEAASSEPATLEVDTVADASSKADRRENIGPEIVASEAVATEVTVPAVEMSREPQPLAVMEEQAQLSTEKSTGLSPMYKGKAWLMAQPSGHYVLQLAQLSSEASVMTYIKQMGLEGKANYYHAHTNAGRVYVVLYSESYPGFQAAKQAVRQMFSAELQTSVWYRRYQALQTSYRAP